MLHFKYSSVLWVAIVYDPVSGWDKHTVQGQYYHISRHCGHNIVVSRVILPSSCVAPSDLMGKFWRAFKPTYNRPCGNWWCTWRRYSLKAKESVLSTWNSLHDEGLHPVMLHMRSDGVEWGVSWHFGSRLIYHLPHHASATLVAES